MLAATFGLPHSKTCEHTRRRIKVECAISGAQRLGCVTQVYRNKSRTFNGRVTPLACGIWNWQLTKKTEATWEQVLKSKCWSLGMASKRLEDKQIALSIHKPNNYVIAGYLPPASSRIFGCASGGSIFSNASRFRSALNP